MSTEQHILLTVLGAVNTTAPGTTSNSNYVAVGHLPSHVHICISVLFVFICCHILTMRFAQCWSRMAKDFMLLFIEYLRCFTVKDSIQHTHSGANMYMCTRVVYMRVYVHTRMSMHMVYSHGLDMRIYVFVSACACSPFLSDILTHPQYFFISFTSLIVLLYCYVLWCCTFVTWP